MRVRASATRVVVTIGLVAAVALDGRAGVRAQRAPPRRVSAVAGTVTVEITPLRDSDGVIRAALYDAASEWLSYDGAIAGCVSAAHVGASRCTFGPVPAGDYAVAVLHDEDGDGHMATDWAGVPTEGYAFSNDAPVVLAPPSYSSATFRHGATDQTLGSEGGGIDDGLELSQ